MPIKDVKKRLSSTLERSFSRRSSRDEAPVEDKAAQLKMPANGYLSPEEDEQTDSFPDNPVQSSLRRVQSSKTTRSLQTASAGHHYTLTAGGKERDQFGSFPRAVSTSAVAQFQSPDTNFIGTRSTSSLSLGPKQPLYMPSATRRQRRASLHEIGYGKTATYQKLEKLGEGTYATVFKGRSVITDDVVALKEIRLEHEEGAPCTAIREVSLLKDLKHANIVCLHDIIHTHHSLTLIFEYVDQDLKQYLDRCNGMMSMINIRLFLFQLLRGLEYCHSRRVLHRDLKPQNLLIGEKGDLKLADFGLARAKSVPTKTYSNEVVTLWYRPPEILLGSVDYNSEIDMWGVGCIFYEMGIGKPMFPGASVEEELELIWKSLGTPTEETWPSITRNEEFVSYNFHNYPPRPMSKLIPRLDEVGIDLLSQFLALQSKNRILAYDAMRHPFFQPLGKRVLSIPSVVSIFTLPECVLAVNPGQRDRDSSNPGVRRDRRKSAYH